MILLQELLSDYYLDEESDAAQQAKQQGLVYKGFGRWADPKTGVITHKTDNGQLVPVQTGGPGSVYHGSKPRKSMKDKIKKVARKLPSQKRKQAWDKADDFGTRSRLYNKDAEGGLEPKYSKRKSTTTGRAAKRYARIARGDKPFDPSNDPAEKPSSKKKSSFMDTTPKSSGDAEKLRAKVKDQMSKLNAMLPYYDNDAIERQEDKVRDLEKTLQAIDPSYEPKMLPSESDI